MLSVSIRYPALVVPPFSETHMFQSATLSESLISPRIPTRTMSVPHANRRAQSSFVPSSSERTKPVRPTASKVLKIHPAAMWNQR